MAFTQNRIYFMLTVNAAIEKNMKARFFAVRFGENAKRKVAFFFISNCHE